MDVVIKILVVMHFIGMAMGYAVSIANIVMSVLMSRVEAMDRAILGKFPPMMSTVGTAGLGVLWVTGIALVFTKWQGFTMLPSTFWYKLGAVVCLTVTVAIIHRLQRLVRTQGPSALPKLQAAGKVATVFALVSLILAVFTFR
ncbi:MAG: hypothetical protein HZC36_10100 [Armatimonadetes bacterium]|nr:hypothetical protein [Armatimonadota bacterium]